MKLNLKKWMADFDNNENLFELTIPGSHDCVTQFVQFPHHFQTQSQNIYEQLNIGIRALDIRVESKGERLKMVHGVVKAFCTANRSGGQMDLENVLDHCYKFLEENPSETIIFQFKNDSNSENEKCFDNLFYTYIKGNEGKWFTENRVPNLGESRGKIVLIRRCKMRTDNKEFTDDNTGIDFSRWIEQRTAEPHALTLETKSKDNAVFIIQDRFKYKPVERWNECLKPFLDSMGEFDGRYIINYTSTAGGSKGPKKNSEIINEYFMGYQLDKSKYYGTIYLDFPFPKLTEKIILHNYK